LNKARVFLDHNASAPLRPEAREAMLAALSMSGVASSVHAEGRAARRVVEVARGQVAALVGVQPEAVVFTASASEANNMALTPDWRQAGGAPSLAQCFVSAIEHPCVLKGSRFPAEKVFILPVGGNGMAQPDQWAARLGGVAKSAAFIHKT
jgi:cysteine desulfurase